MSFDFSATYCVFSLVNSLTLSNLSPILLFLFTTSHDSLLFSLILSVAIDTPSLMPELAYASVALMPIKAVAYNY